MKPPGSLRTPSFSSAAHLVLEISNLKFEIASALRCDPLPFAVQFSRIRRHPVKTRYSIALLTLLTFAVFSLAFRSNAQRTRGPKVMVTSLSASIDKDGPHPDKAEIKEPAPITCISAISDDRNSPTPACKITAPGFSGVLATGKSANVTEAGTVTLACTGTGWVRCNAQIN